MTTAIRTTELQSLARLVGGEPRAALRRLLRLLCEQLGADLAVAATVSPDGRRRVRVAVRADGTHVAELEGRERALVGTWCGAVAETGHLLVRDVADHPEVHGLAGTAELGIASYAGTALRDADGVVVGTLCGIAQRPHDSLNDRDRELLAALGDVVLPLLQSLDRPALPAPRPPALAELADVLAGADDVERLSRPLLEGLHELTGLASAYLGVIDEDSGVQELRYTRNTRPDFVVPEGLRVPWEDTMCKRALDEGRSCVLDVPDAWSDCGPAVALGVQVYVSVPITLSDGRMWGTLCGVDPEKSGGAEAHLPTLRLFARLIAAEVERAQARRDAEVDPLTGCSTRRVVEPWLTTALAGLGDDLGVLVMYADVDRFKEVNDSLGHAAGDEVLAEAGRRLRAAARPSDLVARLGGDEFVVACVVPRSSAAAVEERVRAAGRFTAAGVDVRLSLGGVVSEGQGPGELLAAADRAMYRDKLCRHS